MARDRIAFFTRNRFLAQQQKGPDLKGLRSWSDYASFVISNVT